MGPVRPYCTMVGTLTRRRLLHSAGTLSLGILGGTGIAAAADCSATLDTNAETESGDSKLEVPPEEGVELSGTSTCASGSELTVRIESQDSSSPFLSQPRGTVGEDGQFGATADLSHLDTGTSITVEISYDGDSISPVYEGEVVENPPTATPSPTPTPTEKPTATETTTPATETEAAAESTSESPTSATDASSTTVNDETTSAGDGGGTEPAATDGSGPGFGVVSLLGGAAAAIGVKIRHGK